MAAFTRKRRHYSECDSLSDCTASSSGRAEGGLHANEAEGDSCRQQQLRLLREENASARLRLQQECAASREQQAHVSAQLAELEGWAAAAGGDGGSEGGALCVADLQRQLREYAAKERDASERLRQMERQYEERLAALLAERGGGIGGEGAGAPGRGAAAQGQNSDRSMPPPAAQPPSALRKQQQLGGQGSCQLSGMQQAQLQTETTEQQQQQQQQHQSEELQAALAAETARVDADVERVAVEQALASSGIATRSRKKPRKEGISQVWEWLQGGGGPGEAGAAQQQQQQQQLAPPPQQPLETGTG